MAQPTVLIVEDDEITATLISHIVSTAGFQTLTAMDGVTAVELYQQHLPDIVLLDINLPQLHGYSFASLVRNFSDHRPRIIVITSSLEDYEQHLRELTDGCLIKPINRQDLLQLIAK